MFNVSGYDDVFIEAFGRGVEELPKDNRQISGLKRQVDWMKNPDGSANDVL